jgi:hypothetical protein
LTDYLSVLNELAAALGQSDLAKLAPNERPREVKRALENRKALLILDNLETFDKTERDRLFQFLEEPPTRARPSSPAVVAMMSAPRSSASTNCRWMPP